MWYNILLFITRLYSTFNFKSMKLYIKKRILILISIRFVFRGAKMANYFEKVYSVVNKMGELSPEYVFENKLFKNIF